MTNQDKQNLRAILRDYTPKNWQNELLIKELIIKLENHLFAEKKGKQTMTQEKPVTLLEYIAKLKSEHNGEYPFDGGFRDACDRIISFLED